MLNWLLHELTKGTKVYAIVFAAFGFFIVGGTILIMMGRVIYRSIRSTFNRCESAAQDLARRSKLSQILVAVLFLEALAALFVGTVSGIHTLPTFGLTDSQFVAWKTAHVLSFALMAVTIYGTVNTDEAAKAYVGDAIAVRIVLFCFAWGTWIEFGQFLALDNHTPSPRDVALDVLGGFVGLAFIWLTTESVKILRKKQARKKLMTGRIRRRC